MKREEPPKKTPDKKKEKLSKKDLEELMGVNAPTFKKHKGVWRRK